jgi:hypothetical protein
MFTSIRNTPLSDAKTQLQTLRIRAGHTNKFHHKKQVAQQHQGIKAIHLASFCSFPEIFHRLFVTEVMLSAVYSDRPF